MIEVTYKFKKHNRPPWIKWFRTMFMSDMYMTGAEAKEFFNQRLGLETNLKLDDNVEYEISIILGV